MTNNSIGTGCMTFVSQNLGAGDAKRAKEGVRSSVIIGFAFSVVAVSLIIVFAPYIVAFFNDKDAVVMYGTLALRTVTPFFLLHCISSVLMSALRGTGNSTGPFIAMIFCMIGVRQTYLYLMTHFVANTPNVVVWAFPTGWVVMFAVILIMYFRTDFEAKAGKRI